MKSLIVLALLAAVTTTVSGHMHAANPAKSSDINAVRRWLCEEPSTCSDDAALRHEPAPVIGRRVVDRVLLELADAVTGLAFGRPYPKRALSTAEVLLHAAAAAHPDAAAGLGAALSPAALKQHAAAMRGGDVGGRNGILASLHAAGQHLRALPAQDPNPIPFALLPMHRGDALFGGAPVALGKGVCFAQLSASAVLNGTIAAVTVQGSGAASLECEEQVLVVIGGGAFAFHVLGALSPSAVLSIDVSAVVTDADKRWYAQTFGARVFTINTGSIVSTIVSVIDTVELLAGFGEAHPPPAVLAANLYFIREYIQGGGKVPRMAPMSTNRTAGNVVAANLDPNVVQTGDAFLLLRTDGLDPMIGWGEGADAGHSVIAIRNGSTLLICESTVTDAYWPTNGIQCHGWEAWLALCEGAGQNVVHLPMLAANRANFDTAAALRFYEAHQGVDYGYQTFLFGWLDTVADNFPCTPGSNYTICLDSTFAAQLAFLFDAIFEDNHQNFFRQALAHRAGVWTAAGSPTVASILRTAQTEQNLSFGQLYTLPEQDAWLYQTTQNGSPVVSKSMVCCVFVCNMWKAAGVFGPLADTIQCGEQTLWDIFSMQLFDGSQFGTGRPEVCQQADPQNPLCQIMGDITLVLKPDVNTRPLYPHMGERCSALAPEYVRPAGC